MGLRVGRYETTRAIASGGMATVHLGRALGEGGFERLVAIKVMHPHLATDPEFIAMFLDEARLAAKIRHPNVVPTLDVQKSPDGLFLVMDYVEGASLQVLLRTLRKEQRRVPLDVSLRIVVDALEGLHAAHELIDADGRPYELVHRDVSPQNILVGSDGIARITDFGIARAHARLASTRSGQIKGKLAYASPEQIRSEPIDRRCDVYACAVVMWELLAGRRLFKADDESALVMQAVQGARQTPREVDPSVPAALDSVTMRGLAISVEDRWATAAAFAEAIEAAAGASGTAIATARMVAAFVRSVPIDTRADASGGAPISSPSATSAAPASRLEPTTGSASAAHSTTGVGTAVITQPEKPRAVRWGVIGAVMGAVIATAASVAILRSGATSHGSPVGGNTTTPSAAQAPAAPSATELVGQPARAPETSTAVPPATVSARPSAHGGPPRAPTGAPATAPRGTSKPRASPTSFQPPEL